MKLFSLSALLVCGVAAGIPVDLDVKSKGELLIPREEGFFRYHLGTGQVTPIQGGPEEGQPICARLAPSGTEVLLVVKGRDKGEFRDYFRCDLVPLAGGKGRTVYKADNLGNVQISPDGTQLAVIRSEPFSSKEAELHLVDVKTGESRELLKKVGHVVRWFSDSKRLLVFRIQSKKDLSTVGEMVTCDAATGKATPVAGLLTNKDVSFDLSPDNRKVLVTANRAGTVGAELKSDETLKAYLFELDLGSKEVRTLKTQALHVRYSPTGKKVLLTRESARDFLGRSQELVVTDAGLGQFNTIVSFTAGITIGREGECFPGWIDDERLFYFTERMVFGLQGKALHLVLIGADGGNKKFVQPDIDEGVEKTRAAAKPVGEMK